MADFVKESGKHCFCWLQGEKIREMREESYNHHGMLAAVSEEKRSPRLRAFHLISSYLGVLIVPITAEP